MIALTFAYYNYKFATYKFIDFSKIILYSKSDIFVPTEKKYAVILFSSKSSNLEELIKKYKGKAKVLAIDFFQQRKDFNGVIYLTGGINRLIKIIWIFNIKKLPALFEIKRVKKSLYKQNSKIFYL